MEEARRRIRRWKKQKNHRKWLNISGLDLTELPLIPSKVRRLNCKGNALTAFRNALPTQLKQLRCGDNLFQEFDTLPSTLKTLNCAWSRGRNLLDTLPDSIECIVAEQCERIVAIQTLPLQLKYLNLSCTYNLERIDMFPPNLEECSIVESNLEQLPVFPPKLKVFTCEQSYIQVLPQLPDTLEYLNIYGNTLQILPVLPASLRYLDIRCNPQLSFDSIGANSATVETILYDKDDGFVRNGVLE
jgi:Leucine-rich repeat (LRR) protein